jgi:hypothetical protein
MAAGHPQTGFYFLGALLACVEKTARDKQVGISIDCRYYFARIIASNPKGIPLQL